VAILFWVFQALWRDVIKVLLSAYLETEDAKRYPVPYTVWFIISMPEIGGASPPSVGDADISPSRGGD